MFKLIRYKLTLTNWHVIYSTFLFKLELHFCAKNDFCCLVNIRETVHFSNGLAFAYTRIAAKNGNLKSICFKSYNHIFFPINHVTIRVNISVRVLLEWAILLMIKWTNYLKNFLSSVFTFLAIFSLITLYKYWLDNYYSYHTRELNRWFTFLKSFYILLFLFRSKRVLDI